MSILAISEPREADPGPIRNVSAPLSKAGAKQKEQDGVDEDQHDPNGVSGPVLPLFGLTALVFEGSHLPERPCIKVVELLRACQSSMSIAQALVTCSPA